MNQIDILDDFILSMCEGAKAFIVTLINFDWIELAKFCFVSVGMVKLLQFVMGSVAVWIVTFLLVTEKVTVLNIRGSSFVLVVMII